MYGVTLTYDQLFVQINTNVPVENRISRREELPGLYEKYPLLRTSIEGFESAMKSLEDLIYILYDLRNYRHIAKLAQDMESTLCRRTIEQFACAFFGLVTMALCNLGLVIVSLRLLTLRNKMNEDPIAKP